MRPPTAGRRMTRLALLVALAVGLVGAWLALVWTATRLGVAPMTLGAVLLGVASTLVGQALARGRR